MRKFRYPIFYLISLAIACAAIAVLRYQPPVTTQLVATLDRLPLPTALQQRLYTDTHAELLLVRYQDRIVEYIYHGNASDRAIAVVNLFKKLASSSRYQLQPGDYLFNLHDGTYEDYGWPILGFAAQKHLVANQTTVLIPAPEIFNMTYDEIFAEINKKIKHYPWEKKISKILWRGSLTGSVANNDLLGSERLRFLHHAQELDFVDIGLTGYTQHHDPQLLQKVAELYPLKNSVSPGDAQAYKYLIDIDGNSCSYSRMAWILFSNSTLFKHASDNIQWYYDDLQPYVHYVPVAQDFSDLQTQFEWSETHPAEAREIAENGRMFAKKTFTEHNILQATADALAQYQKLVALRQNT
jgi:hypothetical protein